MNEKYIPLYRKYRPQKLEQVVGQEHIKKALKNAIELDKISHAYLFTGPRGTGKTSTARIFAKSLNCKEGPTISPCGVCENCVDITNSTPMDVIEMMPLATEKLKMHRIFWKRLCMHRLTADTKSTLSTKFTCFQLLLSMLF